LGGCETAREDEVDGKVDSDADDDEFGDDDDSERVIRGTLLGVVDDDDDDDTISLFIGLTASVCILNALFSDNR
jgi:hypothetical protein